MVDRIIQIDKELLIFLNNLGNELFDNFWLTITNQFNWTPLFIFILYVIFKKLGLKKGLFTCLFIIFLVVFSDQFTNMIRGIFERLRPNNDISVSKFLRPSLINPQSFSFISGHATTSTFLTVFVVLLLKDLFKPIKLLFLFPLFFAYSRIYLGVHFPIDILVGGTVGGTFGYLFFKLYSIIESYLEKREIMV
ncbi:phosphatase PAP2 family protein [Tenacibaculum sp. C7A-26P2]|uniref:phosphatase PAP2 family protein n=1 Tax=Tenacibaculum sp. C7A-26P2 TaxID=3447504 RepID=UPI003F856408